MALVDVTVYTGTQFRVAGLQPDVVVDYVSALESGAVFPPIHVVYDGSVYYLADGFHRVEAYRRHGVEIVDANVVEGTLRDAMLYAMQANLRHGLRPSRADKRKAVEAMLQDIEWCSWSDREIGRHCGVDGKTVASIAEELRIDRQSKRTTLRSGRRVEVETSSIGAKRATDDCGIPQSSKQTEPSEPTDKDKAAADKVAKDYGWSIDDALVYVLCLESKRQQDRQRRAERKAEAERLRQKMVRKLRKSLPEAKRKRIVSGLQEASELARQYGVSTSVVLDVVRADAQNKR